MILPHSDYIYNFGKKDLPMDLREHARQIYNAAIEVVKPDQLIQEKVVLDNHLLKIDKYTFDLSKFDKIYVIGAGKASALMAKKLEQVLDSRIFYGIVSVKYGHAVTCQKIRILEAGHPVIDENTLSATEQMLQILKKVCEKDLVLCLLSGGGSALLESLPEKISLSHLQKVFELLLRSGSNIEEINSVRKHLSLVKGGQLARAIYPATCLSFILSDVIGNPLDAIASGPTSPDPTTFQDAWRVLEKYNLLNDLPASIKNHLSQGKENKIPETLKPDDPIFEKVYNVIIGNNLMALEAAKKTAQDLGYNTLILSSQIQGEAREVSKVVASIVQEILENDIPLTKPACFLLGGETTVTIRGKGKGGRNQELALAALLSMRKVKGKYLIVSCGTDGTDGPTDAAGGMVDADVWQEAAKFALDPQEHLEENNAYPFLEKTDALIKTGPTGTNVMDIIFALVP
jgi:glycerate 2-kinase